MSNVQQAHSVGCQSQDSLDDAEKGMYDSTAELTAPPPFVYASEGRPTHPDSLLSPVSPVHEGITPCTSVPELALPKPGKSEVTHIEIVEKPLKKPTPLKPKTSRWVLFELWFNAYRRFFTFVVTLNIIGIILAATGQFKYAENHLGALVLGNLLCAILMRNELFVRFLYILAIYGLRSVGSNFLVVEYSLTSMLVGSIMAQDHNKFSATASWRYTFGMCIVWRSVGPFENKMYTS